MARDVTTLTIQLNAEDKASGVISSVTASFSRMGAVLQGAVIGAVSGVTQSLIGSLIPALTSSVRAASESEDSLNKLKGALTSLGDKGGGVAAALDEQSQALQKVTRFSDEAIKNGQGLLASFVKTEEGLKKGTVAALNLSTALGIDLQSAFLLLAKAAEGNTVGLGKIGIVIDESVPKAQRYTVALEKLNEKFGGRAQQDAQTFSGQLAILGNSFDELQEATGRAVVGNEKIVGSLRSLNAVLQDEGTIKNAESLATAITDLGAATTTEAVRSFNELALAFRAWNGDVSAGLSLLPFLHRQMEDGNKVNDASVLLLRDLVASYQRLSEEQARNAAAQKSAVDTSKEAYDAEAARMKNLRTLTLLLGDAAKAQQVLAETEAQSARVNRELTAAQDEASLAAGRLGVTLTENVNKAISENNRTYEKLVESLRGTKFEAEDVARAHDVLVRSNQALLDSLNPVSSASFGVADGHRAISTAANEAAASESNFAQQLLLTGEGFATHLIRLNQVKAAYAALGEQAQTAAQKITGANESMLGPLDKPGDPLPSNLGRTRGGVSLPAGVAGTATSNYFTLNTPLFGQVQAFKVASQGVGSGLATTFYTLPNGRVVTDDYTLWAVNPTLNPTGRF